MMTPKWAMRCLSVSLQVAALSMLAVTARAQASYDFAPPHVEMTDPVGVQLNSGLPEFVIAPLSIGPAEDRFVYRQRYTAGHVDYPSSGLFGTIEGSSDEFLYGGGALIVKVLDLVEPFTLGADGAYHSWSQNGATLSVTGGYVYNFTDRNGATYTFYSNQSVANCTYTSANGTPSEPCAGLAQVSYPNGQTIKFLYPPSPTPSAVVRNDGYVFRGAQAINLAVDYCDLTQATCTFSRPWPQWTASGTAPSNVIGSTYTSQVTDPVAVQTKYTEQVFDALGTGNNSPLYRVVGVKAGSSPGPDTTSYSYINPIVCVPFPVGQNCNTPRPAIVGQVTTSGGQWTYTYTQLNPTAPPYTTDFGRWQTKATRPDGFQTVGIFNIVTGYVESVVASNGSLVYQANSGIGPNRLTDATDSEGRHYSFTYDGRGNVLTKTQVAASGGTNAVLQANYDAVCSNPVTCNKPNWVRDAKNNQTDYTYDPIHGGVLTETSPAPDNVRVIRPQTRYSYVQRYAWTKNAGGGYSPAATPIWKLDKVSTCKTGTWSGSPGKCANSSGVAIPNDEVVTSNDYGPDSGPNNLLLRGQVVTAEGQSHRTCYGYDALGNKISETTPNANLGSCP